MGGCVLEIVFCVYFVMTGCVFLVVLGLGELFWSLLWFCVWGFGLFCDGLRFVFLFVDWYVLLFRLGGGVFLWFVWGILFCGFCFLICLLGIWGFWDLRGVGVAVCCFGCCLGLVVVFSFRFLVSFARFCCFWLGDFGFVLWV